MHEGYGTCPVCLSVCVSVCLSVMTFSATSFVSTLESRYVQVDYRLFLIHGFSINPSVQKLWREKANMQISSYRSQPVLARFEYRAYISRY